MATKTTTTKPEATKASAKKPRATAVKKPAAHHVEKAESAEKTEAVAAENVTHAKHSTAKGRYIFATGRRKTAIANIRLFEGKGDTVLNKLPIEKYFTYSFFMEEIGKPFEVTGLVGKYYFTGHVNGGGPHAQATAVRHGISQALGKLSEEVRKVLKKNGFLTRDDRKKERKKPGLKRARRSPQWAKR